MTLLGSVQLYHQKVLHLCIELWCWHQDSVTWCSTLLLSESIKLDNLYWYQISHAKSFLSVKLCIMLHTISGEAKAIMYIEQFLLITCLICSFLQLTWGHQIVVDIQVCRLNCSFWSGYKNWWSLISQCILAANNGLLTVIGLDWIRKKIFSYFSDHSMYLTMVIWCWWGCSFW